MSTRRNFAGRDPIAAKVVEFVELWASFRHTLDADVPKAKGSARRAEDRLESEIASAFAAKRKAA